jgi:hypothetical protein
MAEADPGTAWLVPIYTYDVTPHHLALHVYRPDVAPVAVRWNILQSRVFGNLVDRTFKLKILSPRQDD